MNLDFNTLLVMTFLNLGVTAIAGFYVWRANRPAAGLGAVVIGIGIVCAAFGVAFFTKPLLGLCATWIGNAAMITGQFFILDGALQFRAFRRLPVWGAASIASPFLIAQTYLIFVHNDQVVRGIVLAPFMSALCLATACIVMYRLRREEDRFLHSVIALTLTVYAGMQILRAVSLAFPRVADAWLPVLSLLALNVCVISCLFALSTAANLRLRGLIEQLAFCDALTGLPNRRKFEEHLDRVHARSTATGSTVALIYIDLDRFKAINDLYGHGAGDLVLKEMAARLKICSRQFDCLARLGGDEFALLSERVASRSAAITLIEDLHRSLEQPVAIESETLYLTVSCGLAFYPDDVPQTVDLMRQADAEMYRMKRGSPVIQGFAPPRVR